MDYGSDDDNDCRKEQQPIRTRRPSQWRDYHKCRKCAFKTTLTVRMTSHAMIHNFPKLQRLFSCANPIESLNCSQCLNFQTHKLADLKHHFKAGHTLKESKEKLYECDNCTLQTYSNFLYLSHKLLDLCLTNENVKSEKALPEGINQFQTGDGNLTDSKVSKIGYSFDLQRHPKSRHLSENTHQRFKCQFCEFESDKQILLDHMKVCHHLDDDLDSFQCDNYCSYKSPSKSLDDHLSTEFRKCEHCPYTTKQISHLKQHILMKHTDPEHIQWFECEHCMFKSKIKSGLKKHIRVKHTDADEIQWLKCKDCQFKCKTKGNLKAHILNKHTDADELQWFQCENCSHKSKTKGDLKKHIWARHTDPDQIQWFNCEDCPFKTKTKWDLKKHIQVKHTDADEIPWFNCADCLFKSKTKENLKNHIMNKHTDANEIHWFQCEDCSYKCKKKQNLKKHIIVRHTDEDEIQWFECEHCSYKCKVKSSLKRHVDHRHNQKKRLKCDHCPLVTKYMGILTRHVLTKHANPNSIDGFIARNVRTRRTSNNI